MTFTEPGHKGVSYVSPSLKQPASDGQRVAQALHAAGEDVEHGLRELASAVTVIGGLIFLALLGLIAVVGAT